MAMNTISSNVTAINRRSLLKGSVAGATMVPALAVSACAATAPASIAPIYTNWLSLELGHMELLKQFDFWEMFDLMPDQDELNCLRSAITETPADTFEEIAVKLLAGVIEGGGSFDDKVLTAARADAVRLLSANNLVPESRTFSDQELEPLREGQRRSDEERNQRAEQNARLSAVIEEHGAERITELMKEFQVKNSA